MAQYAINHISKKNLDPLEIVKKREEEQVAHFAFCKEQLSSSFGRYTFAFPHICLFFWKREVSAQGEGKHGWKSSQKTKPPL